MTVYRCKIVRAIVWDTQVPAPLYSKHPVEGWPEKKGFCRLFVLAGLFGRDRQHRGGIARMRLALVHGERGGAGLAEVKLVHGLGQYAG